MALGPVMLDVEGLTLTPADRTLLREPAVGGVILFSRNYASPSQLADLVSAIRAIRSPPLLVAVDHEGGRVQRFRDGFSEIPPMRRLGRQHDSDSDSAISLAKTAGWLIASELRAMDIDLCFAPCVDLDWGVSGIIGDRSLHRNPQIVAQLASAFCRGLRSAGMRPGCLRWTRKVFDKASVSIIGGLWHRRNRTNCRRSGPERCRSGPSCGRLARA